MKVFASLMLCSCTALVAFASTVTSFGTAAGVVAVLVKIVGDLLVAMVLTGL